MKNRTAFPQRLEEKQAAFGLETEMKAGSGDDSTPASPLSVSRQVSPQDPGRFQVLVGCSDGGETCLFLCSSFIRPDVFIIVQTSTPPPDGNI